MKRRRWTAEEIRMIQELYVEEGPALLALAMGRSEDSVSSFAHRCGLRTRRWLEERDVVGPIEAGCQPTGPIKL